MPKCNFCNCIKFVPFDNGIRCSNCGKGQIYTTDKKLIKDLHVALEKDNKKLRKQK